MKLIKLFTLSLSIASLSSFAGLIQDLQSGLPEITVKTASKNCPSLQGNWRGTCQDQDGKTTQSQLAIAQRECHLVSYNGTLMVIPGTSSDNIALGSVSQISTVSADWSEDNSTLNFRNVGHSKSLAEAKHVTRSLNASIKKSILGLRVMLTEIATDGIETVEASSTCNYTMAR